MQANAGLLVLMNSACISAPWTTSQFLVYAIGGPWSLLIHEACTVQELSLVPIRVYILHSVLWFIRSRISELRAAVGLPLWLREPLYVLVFVVTLQ
jgi:hypothetical protein